MLPTPANTNDNIFTRQLYQGEPDCLAFAPAARYLIEKYGSAYWKHDIADPDFVYIELTLSRRIMMETRCIISRNLKIKWIAGILEVNPMLLHNDPNLPF